MKPRKIYSAEFKKNAVEMSNTKSSVRAFAEELGIGEALLYKWRKDAKKGKSAPTKESKTYLELENAALKKENRELQMEFDILKKAVHIFSRKDGKSTGL